jgi:hypothetical protein
MLVVPHQEEDVIPGQPVIAGDHVGADLLVRGAEMGLRVRVVDGGGDVELAAESAPPVAETGD